MAQKSPRHTGAASCEGDDGLDGIAPLTGFLEVVLLVGAAADGAGLRGEVEDSAQGAAAALRAVRVVGAAAGMAGDWDQPRGRAKVADVPLLWWQAANCSRRGTGAGRAGAGRRQERTTPASRRTCGCGTRRRTTPTGAGCSWSTPSRIPGAPGPATSAERSSPSWSLMPGRHDGIAHLSYCHCESVARLVDQLTWPIPTGGVHGV